MMSCFNNVIFQLVGSGELLRHCFMTTAQRYMYMYMYMYMCMCMCIRLYRFVKGDEVLHSKKRVGGIGRRDGQSPISSSFVLMC
jgi:hypothetical protein